MYLLYVFLDRQIDTVWCHIFILCLYRQIDKIDTVWCHIFILCLYRQIDKIETVWCHLIVLCLYRQINKIETVWCHIFVLCLYRQINKIYTVWFHIFVLYLYRQIDKIDTVWCHIFVLRIVVDRKIPSSDIYLFYVQCLYVSRAGIRIRKTLFRNSIIRVFLYNFFALSLEILLHFQVDQDQNNSERPGKM